MDWLKKWWWLALAMLLAILYFISRIFPGRPDKSGLLSTTKKNIKTIKKNHTERLETHIKEMDAHRDEVKAAKAILDRKKRLEALAALDAKRRARRR
jgi:hypothetical protein